jgi:hypothetical protein
MSSVFDTLSKHFFDDISESEVSRTLVTLLVTRLRGLYRLNAQYSLFKSMTLYCGFTLNISVQGRMGRDILLFEMATLLCTIVSILCHRKVKNPMLLRVCKAR